MKKCATLRPTEIDRPAKRVQSRRASASFRQRRGREPRPAAAAMSSFRCMAKKYLRAGLTSGTIMASGGLAVPDLGEASRGVVRRWGRRGRLIGCGGLDVRSTRRARGGAGAARGDAGVRSRAHREVLRRGHDVPRAVLRQVRPVRLRAPSSRSPRTRAPRRSRLILIMFFSRPDPRTPTLTSSVPSRPFSRPQWIRRARARRRPRDVPQSRREEGGARARVPLSHVHVRVLLVHVRVGREGRGGRVG